LQGKEQIKELEKKQTCADKIEKPWIFMEGSWRVLQATLIVKYITKQIKIK